MPILIETPDGEQMIVKSLKGHEDCKVVLEKVRHPSHGHAKLEDGKWKEDKEAKAVADHLAKLAKMTRKELVDHILSTIVPV